jgi:hypothetical protein
MCGLDTSRVSWEEGEMASDDTILEILVLLANEAERRGIRFDEACPLALVVGMVVDDKPDLCFIHLRDPSMEAAEALTRCIDHLVEQAVTVACTHAPPAPERTPRDVN